MGKLSSIIKAFNRKSKVDLDNDGKIESLSQEIMGMFSQFTHMHNKLENANQQLAEIVEQEKRQLVETQKRIQKASDEITANTNLQSKVKEFIK